MKAIIFDFDGLILDTETPWYEAYRKTAESYGCELPLSEFVKCIGTGDNSLWEFLKQQLGQKFNQEEIERQATEIHKQKMLTSQAREGVEDYLQEAREKGYSIALASSSTRAWVSHYLKQLGLLQYFDSLTTRDDVDRVKPAPDLYIKAIKTLGIEVHEAIAFEDSLNGLKAAHEAGLKCVIVPNPVTEALAFENHHLRLTSMAEMPLSKVIESIEP
ncbi:HAD family hydrolase [Peribacillus sp. SCS-155]|uniref:HAD family hydrolase n=1 Tax=Peribacillus sedimenti TaxID=3115297 RepID=UPI003906BE46